jgi:hypothetical protein
VLFGAHAIGMIAALAFGITRASAQSAAPVPLKAAFERWL